jgi:hypothetical protein
MENKVPIVDVKVDATPPQRGEMVINIRLRNVGTVPAYRLSWNIENRKNEGHEIPVLAPQQETNQALVYGYAGRDLEYSMRITYYMSQGHCVCDEYTVGVRGIGATVIASGATCHGKTYHVASEELLPFIIAEDK